MLITNQNSGRIGEFAAANVALCEDAPALRRIDSTRVATYRFGD
jgi:hypothetical protein